MTTNYLESWHGCTVSIGGTMNLNGILHKATKVEGVKDEPKELTVPQMMMLLLYLSGATLGTVIGIAILVLMMMGR